MRNLPTLGSKAPEFSANTTMGPIKLSDYKGKWVVLFSHPGDFTPVCTTEFLSFAQYYDEFAKRNAEILGLSTDSNNSHLAWLYNIFELTGVEIPFPLIDDSSRKIATQYGMIQSGMSKTETVRCVYIIDDNQILRTMLYYPLTTGRNIPEILRIIEALQTSDKNNVATPANWFPGMPVVLPSPKTFKELKQRLMECSNSQSCNCIDWYLCFMPDKNLPTASEGEVLDDNTVTPDNTDSNQNDDLMLPNYTIIPDNTTQEDNMMIPNDYNQEEIMILPELNEDNNTTIPSINQNTNNILLKKNKNNSTIISSTNKNNNTTTPNTNQNNTIVLKKKQNNNTITQKKNKDKLMKYINNTNSTQKKYPYVKSNSRPKINDTTNQPTGITKCPKIDHVVMEYVLGNPKNVDPRFLDAVTYAFVEINKDGTLLVPTPTFLKQLVSLKKTKTKLKVIAAIGGWGADGFSDAALTPTSRYSFAKEVNKLIKEYKLDGVDIDWEYPANRAAGITARPEDKENFTLLLTAIRDVIGDDKWLSVAGTGDMSYINKSAEIAEISKIIDYFNLMSYDFTAGETGEGAKNHQANLFSSNLQLNNSSVDRWVKNLISAGMSPSKILLGVPFYGRFGATKTVSYDELRKNYINKNGYFYRFDNQAKVPYLVDSNGNFKMSFENDLSIFFKGQYVLDNCLGGIFSWTSTYDQANILARAMSYSIYNSATLKDELEDIYGNLL